MDLNIRKYRKKDEIIINCFDTWSDSMKKLISDKYEIIKKFRKRNEEIDDLKRRYKQENKIYDIFDTRNEYNNAFNELKEKFKNILLSENKLFICFHSSRYTEKEKDRIKEDGLKISSKVNLYNRIDNLLKDGYINENECTFLKKHNLLLKPNNRENQLWVTTGNVDISTESTGLYYVYNNYGGEIIYCCKDNESLVKKLNILSKPYLVVLKLRPKQIEHNLNFLIENIFNRINFDNSEKVEYEFYTNDEPIFIEDIIEVDENSRIII